MLGLCQGFLIMSKVTDADAVTVSHTINTKTILLGTRYWYNPNYKLKISTIIFVQNQSGTSRFFPGMRGKENTNIKYNLKYFSVASDACVLELIRKQRIGSLREITPE